MVPMDTRMITRVFIIFGSHTTEHTEYSHFISSRSCLYLPTFRQQKKNQNFNFFAIEKHIDQTGPWHRIDLSRSIIIPLTNCDWPQSLMLNGNGPHYFNK